MLQIYLLYCNQNVKKISTLINTHITELLSGMWCATGFIYVSCDLAALDAEIVSCLVCQGVGIHWRVGVFPFPSVWTDYIFNHTDLPIHIE